MRMVDRVHRHAAVMRLATQPARPAGLAKIDVLLIRVGHGTDGRHAFGAHDANLARRQAELGVALILADQLDIGTGGTGDLTALADLHLDIVDHGADRDVLQRQRVAWLDVDLLTGHDLVAGSQTLRGQDVSQLAVLIFDEGDEGGAVRVIFQTLDRRHHIKLVTLEIDDAVVALVPTTTEPDRDATQIVTAAVLAQTFGQRLLGLALPQSGPVDDDQLTLARRGRLESLQCHFNQTPVVTSMLWPSARDTMAFFTSLRLPTKPLKRFVLPCCTSVLTAFTLTLNTCSTAALISPLVASSGTRKVTWLCSEPIVAFSVITGERTMS